MAFHEIGIISHTEYTGIGTLIGDVQIQAVPYRISYLAGNDLDQFEEKTSIHRGDPFHVLKGERGEKLC
jgi:hypothetical protein